jgi:hypothetical protein
VHKPDNFLPESFVNLEIRNECTSLSMADDPMTTFSGDPSAVREDGAPAMADHHGGGDSSRHKDFRFSDAADWPWFDFDEVQTFVSNHFYGLLAAFICISAALALSYMSREKKRHISPPKTPFAAGSKH